MSRSTMLALLIAPLLLAASPAGAQEWRPPTTQMPAMPSMAELSGNWLGPRAEWFAGVATLSGVQPGSLRATAQGRGQSGNALVVHFSNGPIPAVVWQDRNGDGRADLVEIFRSGTVLVQVIDADYDGRANVMRTYSADGTLTREDRL